MTLIVPGVLLLASVPASMFVLNMFFFRRLRPARDGAVLPSVSVLIPARNEESAIGPALMSVLDNAGLVMEVVVLDDGSTDGTASVVRAIAERDPRVRLEQAPPLPEGWTGKQHACYVLAVRSRYDRLCFIDADVRLAPNALRRMLASVESSGAALLSGFPRQITKSFLERLLLPMIHFVLLGFLPIPGLKVSRHPAFAAGCGQLMLARRREYFECRGHSADPATMHDGIRLPHAFRNSGFATDIFDATDLAHVRMYNNAREVWFGLVKNAVEGLAAPGRLPVFTVLLAGGQILPFVLLPLVTRPELQALTACAVLLAWFPRFVAALRFRQPLDSALLHPVGVAVLLVLQWYALIRYLRGRPAVWKGRAYAGSSTEAA